MKNQLEHSPFELNKTEKLFFASSLRKFPLSPLSRISKKDLQTAKTVWANSRSSKGQTFIFVFGGSGASTKIAQSLFPSKNKNTVVVNSKNQEFLERLSSLKKTELKSCRFFFISKSGRTEELLFYTSFLKNLYSQKKISLKGTATILTQAKNSPLLKWAKKENSSVIWSKSFLPGRFSFFTPGGLLQFQAHGFSLQLSTGKTPFSCQKLLEFLIHYSNKKKEVFFCPMNPRLKELAHWMEISWSESLFKEGAKKQPPTLRNISFSKLRHAYIEELITKKNQVCFWAWDTNANNNPGNPKNKILLKKLLKEKNIPYIFMRTPLKDKTALADLLMDFYKIFFCMGQFLKSDIYIQPWVDYFKEK